MVFSESKIGPTHPPLIKQIYGSASEVHLTDRILEKELFYTKVLLQIS